MSLDSVLIVQLIVFFLIFLPLCALPWFLLIWLFRKVFGKKKDEVNNG